MPDNPEPPAPETPPEAPKPPADTLGDPGKKALEEERRARKRAEKEAKEAADALAAIQAESASESEKAIAAARKEGESEATQKANKRVIRSEVKAAAASKLQDPNDAVSMLDLGQFEVDADGNVDESAISAAIDELVTQKPYLAVGARPAPTGNGDGGAHPPAPKVTLQQQIAAAEKAGDWVLSTQLKSQLLAAMPNK